MASAPGRPFLPACLAAALALCMSLCAQALLAAQGSTPEQGPQHNAAASKQTAHSASATARNGMPAPNVYAQGPYTEKELVRFIESMPHFLAWARSADEPQAHPATNAAGRPDFAYTPQAAAKTRELGWEPRRFFCLLGRTAAALYLVGEGTDLVHALPPDMPTVTEAEMALVRKHLASLLHAGAGGPPPALAR